MPDSDDICLRATARVNLAPAMLFGQLEKTLTLIDSPNEIRLGSKDRMKEILGPNQGENEGQPEEGDEEENGDEVEVAAEVENVVIRTAATYDVIADADNGVLSFGNFLVSVDTVETIFPNVCHPSTRTGVDYGIERIRLLGCNTASTERGQAVMKAFQERLGVPVYGTTTKLDFDDYDNAGLRADTKGLRSTDNLPVPINWTQVIESWRTELEIFPGTPEEVIAGVDATMSRLAPRMAARRIGPVIPIEEWHAMPSRISWMAWDNGLQVATDGSYSVPLSQGRIGQVSSLSNGSILRVPLAPGIARRHGRISERGRNVLVFLKPKRARAFGELLKRWGRR